MDEKKPRKTIKERITPDLLFAAAVTHLKKPTPMLIADLKIFCDALVKLSAYGAHPRYGVPQG